MNTAQVQIEGPYLRDLLEQPEAILRTVGALAANPPYLPYAAPRFRFVVLTGMGASLYALAPLHQRLLAAGIAAAMIETSELLLSAESLLRPDVLLIAVSQSGRSAEIVRLLELNKAGATCVGVTNEPDSPLGRLSDSVALTHAGVEATVSCKTYVSTLAALDWLGASLLGGGVRFDAGGWRAAAALMREYLSEWRSHCQESLEACADAETVVVTGRGPSMAAVRTGALILKEASKVPAEGLSAAMFRHGPVELLSPRLLVVVFEGDSRVRTLNRRLFLDVQRAGARAVIISADSPTPAFRLPGATAAAVPALEILPMQMMTLAFAARAGIEPGIFRHASKVTVAE